MGNQMPARCMVPCNPVCCAMCFHSDAGRESDTEHKTGSIFANAASVLSMAAEEISLDDHLEKELANEVELWRMETSSTAVHTNEGSYRTVFAPIGRESHSSSVYDAHSSSMSSPDVTGRLYELEETADVYGDRERLARAQIGEHMNGLGQQRLRVQNANANGSTRENTAGSVGPSEPREVTETSSFAPEASGQTATVAATAATPAVNVKTQKRGDAKRSPRGQSSGAANAASPYTGDAAGMGEPLKNGQQAFTSPRSNGSPRAGPAPQEVVRVQTNLQAETSEASQAHDDQAYPNEASSFSSSEEDSFPGFIEDPDRKSVV